MQPRTADIVIIGAGAIGCSIAYHLGLRGEKNVAVYSPKDGYADPHTVVQGYAAKARASGVKILEQTEVTGIRLRGERVVGVETTSGPIETHLVVNAAGPWAQRVAEMVGAQVPVYPRRRHIFVTEPFPHFVNPSPLVIDRTSGFYCRTEGRGILMSPGDVGEVQGYKVTIDWSMAEDAARKALRRVPVLERAGIMSGWAGLRPLTPDEHAIIDHLPGVEGFLCAIGFCGHGFRHSPAAGKVVAEMILDGNPSIDIAPLSFRRFKEATSTPPKGKIPEPD